jgi:formylglycine-generating enzyme required for sulfatase activity/serine/threonine protein kinase
LDAHSTIHPNDQTLRAYGLGRLDDRSAGSISQHLETCGDCRRRVAVISPDTCLERLRGAEARGDSPAPIGSSLAGISGLTDKPGLPALPPAHAVPPGLVDHPDYEILGELGRGGMGVVYLAQNTLLGRNEVLKVISRELMDRRGVLERFLREIRNAALLQHPNIVTAHRAFWAGDCMVFAMEYVEGHDLARLVRAEGPLQVGHACYFVYQAALGLQHAHEQGMVHRDIKPSNLMLTRQGTRLVIKILDFGLAKATREGPVERELTHEGQMLGTPDYIAPEQTLNAQNADIRADIYSLGCTLYYVLTGGPPFQAASLYEILQAHHSMEALPLNLARPDVPVELAALVAKMMAKEPDRRFQAPLAAAEALKRCFRRGAAGAAAATSGVDLAKDAEAPQRSPTITPSPPAGNQPAADARSPRSLEPARSATAEPLGHAANTLRPARELLTALLAEPARPAVIGLAAALGAVLLALVATWATALFQARRAPLQGTIVLQNLPRDSEVEVDGAVAAVTWPGAGRPAEITVFPGRRTLAVIKPGFKEFRRDVTVVAGSRQEVPVWVERTAIPPPSLTAGDDAGSRPVQPAEARPPEPKVASASVASKEPAAGPPVAKTESVQPLVMRPRPAGGTVVPKKPAPKKPPVTWRSPTTGIEFVRIEGNEFRMGSRDDDAIAFDNEKPQRNVRVSPFYLGTHEVTRGQFRRFVSDAGYRTDAERYSPGGMGWNANEKRFEAKPEFTWQNPGFKQDDDHPVVIVSWNDAQAFVQWLTARDQKTYRLPSEAEWEYACRAGSTTRYSFGDNPEGLKDAGNIADGTAREAFANWDWGIVGRDGYLHTAPVGQFEPNAFHLYDMHGNVCEWCADVFVADAGQRAPADAISAAPARRPRRGGGSGRRQQTPLLDRAPVPGTVLRVVRGGGWSNEARAARSAHRFSGPPGAADAILGFRIARDLSANEAGSVRAAPSPATGVTRIPEPDAETPANPVIGAPGEPTRVTAKRIEPNRGSGSPARTPGERSTVLSTIGISLVLIPDGKFHMGSPEGDRAADRDERPRHLVRITRPFYLGVHEVTRGQFQRFVEETSYRTDAEKDPRGTTGWNEQARVWERNPGYTWRHPGFEQSDDHPAVYVSWNDAQAFLAWLSKKERKRYRLPTEAEWEYVCRYKSTLRSTFDGVNAVANFLDGTNSGLFRSSNPRALYDGFAFTAPVGSFQPNAFQLHDLHGNVAEWCSDGYDANSYDWAPAPRDMFGLRDGRRNYYEQTPVDDPQGAKDSRTRVYRGQSWSDGVPPILRPAQRFRQAPEYRAGGLGFRVVLVQSAL